MGERTTKGRALARYLLGHTGIPFLSWDGSTGGTITAPYPYQIDVSTAASNEAWRLRMMADYDHSKLRFIIRYDNKFKTIDDAMVAMDMRTFVQLMKTHYETVVEPRLKDGE